MKVGAEWRKNLLLEADGPEVPVKEHDIHGMAVKTKGVRYHRETNVFERLSILYGKKVMLNSLEERTRQIRAVNENRWTKLYIS